MRPSAAGSLRSGEIANRYAIEGEIGRGGTAIVYRARDRVRGLDVAIKMMRPDAMGSLSIERFLLEIRRTARLPHPHIVPVLDSGEVEGCPFFVLPFMDGGTLRERLLRDRQLPFEEVRQLGITIARALEFAHAHGVIHRDVKPENILYNNGQPCLADFGTARALERATNDPTTSTGVVRGTAAYMSPEQASGERDYDGRTDIYSLACVLYECIAGIQPFVGPTIQSVLSQRVTHVPRPVSIYRPTVPPEIEKALEKATATQPVDRYQRAGELADALESASVAAAPAVEVPAPATDRTTRLRRGLTIGTAAATLAGAAWIASGSDAVRTWRAEVPLDSTRIVILPFDTTGGPAGMNGEDLLYEGFRHWTGLTINEPYETRDAVRQLARGEAGLGQAIVSMSRDDGAGVARSLGAGRYVRGRFIRTPDGRAVYAAIFDTRSKESYGASIALGQSPNSIMEAFASLADSLVLHGKGSRSLRISHRGIRDAASAVAFLRAREALDDWNLHAADSLFTQAALLDTTDARAELWRAQVRSWLGMRPSEWGSLAHLGRADTATLSTTEMRLGAALTALRDGRYAAACGVYEEIVSRHVNDFAGWYGRGECRRLDRRVVRDSASPSGWRFRSSYEQAIQAYRQALLALPSSFQALQNAGYEPLRLQLFTDPNFLLKGFSEDSLEFYASPAVPRDTAVFIPYPAAEVLDGKHAPDSAVAARAATRHRRYFAEVARQWSLTLPRSAGAKEALAISLEMIGDPAAAADSFRVARGLATDSGARLRLATAEALARIKAGVAGPEGQLDAGIALADSLLHTASPQSPADGELLARLAAITGRCALSGHFAGIGGGAPSRRTPLPPTSRAEVDSAFAVAATGCDEVSLPDVRAILTRTGVEPARALAFDASMLSGLVGLRFPRDTARIRQYASATADYVITAEAMLLRHQGDSARSYLRALQPQRASAIAGSITADVALAEARLWMTLGDPTTAVQLLDRCIDGLQYAQPLTPALVPNLLRLGSLPQVLELRSILAERRGEDPRRWSRVTAALWKHADPSLSSRRKRLAAP